MKESKADREGKYLELNDVAVGCGEGEEHQGLYDVGFKFNKNRVVTLNL